MITIVAIILTVLFMTLVAVMALTPMMSETLNHRAPKPQVVRIETYRERRLREAEAA